MRSVDEAEIMVQESMHAINDLGSKRACEGLKMEDLASYSVLKINVTHLPTALISGLCLPKECTPENLQNFGAATTDKINALLVKLQKKYHIFDVGKGWIRDFTQLTVTLT